MFFLTYRVQHTPSTACTEYNIHCVQHTPSTTYTEYSIHHLQHTPSTAYTKYRVHQVQPTLSAAYTKYRIHQVQPTLSAAYTEDCLSSLYSHKFKLATECSFSFQRTSLHNQPLSASSSWELKVELTLSHSHCCEETNWWIESQHPACHPSIASKYTFNPARWQPPSISPYSLDDTLQVDFETCSSMASKFT